MVLFSCLCLKLWNRLDVSHWYRGWLKLISYAQKNKQCSSLQIATRRSPPSFGLIYLFAWGTYAGAVLLQQYAMQIMCAIHKINRIIWTFHVLMCEQCRSKMMQLKIVLSGNAFRFIFDFSNFCIELLTQTTIGESLMNRAFHESKRLIDWSGSGPRNSQKIKFPCKVLEVFTSIASYQTLNFNLLH